MIKISVIIVCYNGEKYIEECIEKLKKQTYNNYEIVFIDDGSTDKTEELCKKYNKVIKYYKVDHKGIAHARNFGIEKSTGDYFMFVDVDDYIDDDTLEILSKETKETPDIIKYGYKLVNKSGKMLEEFKDEKENSLTGEELFKKLCLKKVPFEMTCVYLYNKKYWNGKKFKYLEGHYHEDFGLTPYVIVSAKKTKIVDRAFYGYVQSDNSITRTIDKEKIKNKAYDYLAHYQRLNNLIDNTTIEEKTKKIFKSYISNAVILKANTLDKEERKKFIKEMKKNNIFDNIQANTTIQKLKKIVVKTSPSLYYRIGGKNG